MRLTLNYFCEGGYDGAWGTTLAHCSAETRTVSKLDSALCIVALQHHCRPVTRMGNRNTLYCFKTEGAARAWEFDLSFANWARDTMPGPIAEITIIAKIFLDEIA